MAFSRDELKEIGVVDDQIENVMSLHGKSVQSLKDEVQTHKQREKEAKDEVKSYEKRMQEQDEQLSELKAKASKGEDLTERINALQEENKQKDEQRKQELNAVKLQYEIDKELNRTGAKNTLAVMALIDRENISYDDEKGLRGLKEQLEDIKESDPYLFTSNNADNDNSQNANSQNNNNSSNYNAGGGRGNNGNEPDADALGEQYYKDLFGDN